MTDDRTPRPVTTIRPGGVALLTLAALLATACIRRPAEEPIALRIWPDALGDARAAVAAGAYPTADTTLARFARQYTGSEQAQESLFLLALFRLDPRNTAATPRDAVRAFDAYLASTDSVPRATEARTLRRLAVRLDSLSQAVAVKAAGPVPPTPREDEIQKLRDSLKSTTDELERIKRRLAQPRP